jgi:thiamine pyrophosphate-dependent acetolactate synthase large subunit-like protein
VTADQAACTAVALEETPDAAVVSNLGTASYHLAALGDRPRNFHLTGAMGVTTPLGLGLALAVDEQVTVLEGDGSLLMSLGTLGTVARMDPPNLVVVVMDNGAFQTTGGQPTLSSVVDLAGVSRECGLSAWDVDSTGAFREAYLAAVEADGTGVVVCAVDAETPESHPSLDYAHAYSKHRFRREFLEE